MALRRGGWRLGRAGFSQGQGRRQLSLTGRLLDSNEDSSRGEFDFWIPTRLHTIFIKGSLSLLGANPKEVARARAPVRRALMYLPGHDRRKAAKVISLPM